MDVFLYHVALIARKAKLAGCNFISFKMELWVTVHAVMFVLVNLFDVQCKALECTCCHS